jgi:putative Mg2+ transporter-C (MgtC) family protein
MPPELSTGDLLLRLGLVVVLCGALGLEREARGREAGLRTHILVGLGAALFTLVSAYGFTDFAGVPGPRGTTGYDPTRIAAQVVTGIGFLGAGVIIRQQGAIRGLTTAAGLWVAAAIGMGAAAGYYVGTAVATALAIVALTLFRPVRDLVEERLGDDSARAARAREAEDDEDD